MASKIKQALLHPNSSRAKTPPSSSVSSSASSPAASTTALSSTSHEPDDEHHGIFSHKRSKSDAKTEAEQLAQKYLLTISAGPSYAPETHTPVVVNSSADQSIPFENQWMRGFIRVRIRSYTGLPHASPQSCPSYFSHPSRAKEQYSISFNFVPKVDLPASTAIWGNDFDHPVRDRLPPGFNFAVNLVKSFVDPSIELDAYADKPWMFAPALCCFFAFFIGDKKETWEKWNMDEIRDADEEPVQEGADGSGVDLRTETNMPSDVTARRKHFRTLANREAISTFQAGRLYKADFFNPYIDFSSFSLKLPGGFNLNCLKYIGDKTHKLRYVFKDSEDPEKVYFCVDFTLLHGEDLEVALGKDDRGEATVAAEIDD